MQFIIYNHYDITEDTLLITNSDMGAGYGLSAFREMAKTLNIRHHEHFWDAYHVHKFIKDFYRLYPEELQAQVLEAISRHSKADLRTVLDTTESLLETEAETVAFNEFRQRLLSLFRFTKPPHLRGLDNVCLGVIESQHRKLTYRMKHRGMYWSVAGAKAISSMIILDQEQQLRNLFFGSWREDYQYYRSIELSATQTTIRKDSLPEVPRTYKVGQQALRAMPSLKAILKRF